MLALAITAIITAFAVPGFQDLMARSRVNSATEELVNALQQARTTAISRARVVVLVPTDNTWTFRLDTDTGDVLSEHVMPATLQLRAWHGAPPGTDVEEVTFLASGMVRLTKPSDLPLELTLEVCDSGSVREVGRNVTLSRVGRLAVAPHANRTVCNP